MPGLWVLAPVFNEEENLKSFIAEWIPVLRKSAGEDFVFCLINDGSTDRSLEIIKGLAQDYPEILIIDKSNAGHGPTCLLGYRMGVESGADWIFQIDSDGQCDPYDFDTFWRARSTGPVHYGERKGREDGLGRRLISRLLAVIVFLLSFRWIRDPNVPYRLMDRKSLDPALNGIPAGFGLTNVLLSMLQAENPGIEWHRIRFRRRPGRQNPLRISVLFREAAKFFRDYFLWILRRGRANPSEAVWRIGRPLLGFIAAYYLLVFSALALLRIGVFAEYGWIESVHLTQVHRVLMGQPLYTAPSLEYVPLLYGPLYAYVSSAFSLFFGESYAALRFVSLASTIGTLIVIWLMVMRISGSKWAAWVAAGLYSGMYRVVGLTFDAGRLDSLFVFFTVTMAYNLWRAHEKGGRAAVYAALAAAAAVLTKQTALVPVFALSLWSLTAGNPRGRIAGYLCVGSVFLSQVIPIAATDGWFFYYLYKLPSTHPISYDKIHGFFQHDFLRHLSIGLILALWALVVLFKENRGKGKSMFCLIFLAALSAAGLAPRFKVGGSVNNLIPIAAALAVCCGLAAAQSLYRKKRIPALVILLLIGFAIQIFYFPQNAVPSRRALIEMRMKADLFRSLEAPIFAPCDPYVSLLVGKNSSAFWGAIYDVWLTPGETSDHLRAELGQALEERRFRTVVLREEFFKKDQFPYAQLKANYESVDYLEGMPQGWGRELPLEVYIPRK